MALFSEEERLGMTERTLQLMLAAAAQKVLPEKPLRIEHTFGRGLFFHAKGRELTGEELRRLEACMHEMAEKDLPIVPEGSAEEYRCRLGELSMRVCGPTKASAGAESVFAIVPYLHGALLMLPDREDPTHAAPVAQRPKLAQVYAESVRWNRILGVNNLGDVNAINARGELRELIRVNEALHERRIHAIADGFAASGARVLLIAGPSSSGKTTFSNRLCVALRVLGYRPVKISVDDYYMDRDKCPLEPDGTRDLERIDILDLPLLNEHLSALLEGKRVEAPEFDFATQTRTSRTHPVQVEQGQPIVIEGIHCLNELLTSAIPREMKFKVYISALTTLNVDDMNRIRTSDLRLLRRTVRDYMSRGTMPETTLTGWDSVRRGEEKYIFPFQEEADMMFNSTLVYELTAIKSIAAAALNGVDPEGPAGTRAVSMLRLLELVDSPKNKRAALREIPVDSLLREFIGGCTFYQ